MHCPLRFLPVLLILVDHHSLRIHFVKLSHPHDIDILWQAVHDHIAGLEETSVLDKD